MEKKRIGIIAMVAVLVTILSISSSYAIFKLTIEGKRNYKISIGTLDFEIQNEANAIGLNNAYPMDDSQGQTLTPYTFSITNTGTLAEYYKISLVEDETQKAACKNCKFLANNKIKFELKEDGTTVGGPELLSDTDNILRVGQLAVGQTKNYELRIWLTAEATLEEANKYYFGKIKVESSQEEYKMPEKVKDKLFASANLGSNCATYNDGVDTFLVGQCSNNYVWYSGKLWRVVLKNNATGAVKMVTDNAITTIPYHASSTAFKDSYMDQWLNQEFLPTLHDASDYLVTDYVWDATEDSSSTPTRPAGTTTVQRTVGLLNAYEYYTTYASSNSLATYSTTYLRNNVYWWLMTPYNASSVRNVLSNGTLNNGSPTYGGGARPSVNLKSTIQIDSGSGSKSDPYILKGDIQETIPGTTLLSTRYSGEYLTFNNELYRIVGIENINGEVLTKITAVDKPSSLSSNVFHSATGVTNFANASIKSDLETYYQGLNEPWKSMIQPNTTWYLGYVGSRSSYGNYHYKASICATVDANTSTQNCTKITDTSKYTTASIALPRAGEMFTSQITRGTTVNFWTLTPYSTSNVRNVYNSGDLSYTRPTYGNGARPSMYLKSTIRIASGNTGNGMFEHPYQIQ